MQEIKIIYYTIHYIISPKPAQIRQNTKKNMPYLQKIAKTRCSPVLSDICVTI